MHQIKFWTLYVYPSIGVDENMECCQLAPILWQQCKEHGIAKVCRVCLSIYAHVWRIGQHYGPMFKNPQVRVITRYSGVRRLALGKINTCFHIKQKLLGRSSGNTAAAALELVCARHRTGHKHKYKERRRNNLHWSPDTASRRQRSLRCRRNFAKLQI